MYFYFFFSHFRITTLYFIVGTTESVQSNFNFFYVLSCFAFLYFVANWLFVVVMCTSAREVSLLLWHFFAVPFQLSFLRTHNWSEVEEKQPKSFFFKSLTKILCVAKSFRFCFNKFSVLVGINNNNLFMQKEYINLLIKQENGVIFLKCRVCGTPLVK